MTIRDLSLRYEGTDHSRETLALSGVNLDIMEGDFICVLGPSGCGKSTLLNIMAGLLQATEGTIEMLGEPVTGVDWKRAVVFQTPTLYPWLDVYKNVAFGPDVRGIDKKENLSEPGRTRGFRPCETLRAVGRYAAESGSGAGSGQRS